MLDAEHAGLLSRRSSFCGSACTWMRFCFVAYRPSQTLAAGFIPSACPDVVAPRPPGEIGTGWAPNFPALVFWRAVTGVGSSVQYAGRELFLADISHVGNRGRTLGAVSVSCRRTRDMRHVQLRLILQPNVGAPVSGRVLAVTARCVAHVSAFLERACTRNVVPALADGLMQSAQLLAPALVGQMPFRGDVRQV